MFLHSITAPSVACPTLIYSSQGDTVVVPAPLYAGFINGPVSFTYTYQNGISVNLVDGTIPFHTLTSVQGGQMTLTVTVQDTSTQRSCTIRVFAFAGKYSC